RTRVTAVKGRCPGPLDDGDARGKRRGGRRTLSPTGRARLHVRRPADNVSGKGPEPQLADFTPSAVAPPFTAEWLCPGDGPEGRRASKSVSVSRSRGLTR